jgi:hypothetical protein
MASNNLRVVDGQGELALTRAPQQAVVADEVVRAQPSFKAALRLAANVSGLEEKEIYIPLKIDASHWTRIMNGQAHFPDDKLEAFMDLVGNEIPLQWLAHRRGKGLHMLLTEAERLLYAERSARERVEAENKLLRDLVQGRAA